MVGQTSSSSYERTARRFRAEHLWLVFELSGSDCTAIITNTLHNAKEACSIVENLIALVEGQYVDFVAALFRSIWGAEPGRLPYLNRPSFTANPLLLASSVDRRE
jgi:hypothetical protein